LSPSDSPSSQPSLSSQPSSPPTPEAVVGYVVDLNTGGTSNLTSDEVNGFILNSLCYIDPSFCTRRYLRTYGSGEEITVTQVADNRYSVSIVFFNRNHHDDIAMITDAMFNGEFVSVVSLEASKVGIPFVHVDKISGGPKSLTSIVEVSDVSNAKASNSTEPPGEKLSSHLAETSGLMPRWGTFLLSILSALVAGTLLYLAYTGWSKKTVFD